MGRKEEVGAGGLDADPGRQGSLPCSRKALAVEHWQITSCALRPSSPSFLQSSIAKIKGIDSGGVLNRRSACIHIAAVSNPAGVSQFSASPKGGTCSCSSLS